MSMKSEEFFRKMLEFLPSTRDKYQKTIEFDGERLDTVVIEQVFMPVLVKYLEELNDIGLLENIFNYFEEVSNCGDTYLVNIYSVTVLEILGNDMDILKNAQKFMGPRTSQLQIQADRSLGRVR